MLCAEPVRAPGITANSPTSPAVLSSLMHIECRDIFRPSLVNEQSIELGVPLRWRGCIDNLANLAESVFCRGAPAEIRLALGRKASSQVGGLSSSVFSSETLSNRGEVAARGAGYFTRGWADDQRRG
jgi:hypothetical protein